MHVTRMGKDLREFKIRLDLLDTHNEIINRARVWNVLGRSRGSTRFSDIGAQ